jgi:hypothetical protein
MKKLQLRQFIPEHIKPSANEGLFDMFKKKTKPQPLQPKIQKIEILPEEEEYITIGYLEDRPNKYFWVHKNLSNLEYVISGTPNEDIFYDEAVDLTNSHGNWEVIYMGDNLKKAYKVAKEDLSKTMPLFFKKESVNEGEVRPFQSDSEDPDDYRYSERQEFKSLIKGRVKELIEKIEEETGHDTQGVVGEIQNQLELVLFRMAR